MSPPPPARTPPSGSVRAPGTPPAGLSIDLPPRSVVPPHPHSTVPTTPSGYPHHRTKHTRRNSQALQSRRPTHVSRGSFYTQDHTLLAQRNLDPALSASPTSRSRDPSVSASSRATAPGANDFEHIPEPSTADEVASISSVPTNATFEPATPGAPTASAEHFAVAASAAAAATAYARRPSAYLPSGLSWTSKENARLHEDNRKERYWKRWGPYVSERQWGTVREDYSGNGDAWAHFPHEMARSRAYRWGEDGIGGISDSHCRLAFSLALWNGNDSILKERLFGIANPQGNHGEDVKEMYWYADNTPTHSYMKYIYKYPQVEYPYEQLVRESTNRSRDVNEFEIADTDIFDEGKYWDVVIEYAKDEDEENATSIRISAFNRGTEPADLHIIPQLLFRNTWSWDNSKSDKPSLQLVDDYVVQADHEQLGRYFLYCSTSPAPSLPVDHGSGQAELVSDEEVLPEMLFTENETNFERLYGGQNANTYAKDAFHDHIIFNHRLDKDKPTPSRHTRMIKKQIPKMVSKPLTVLKPKKSVAAGRADEDGTRTVTPSTPNSSTPELVEAEDGDEYEELTEYVSVEEMVTVEEEEEYFVQTTERTRDYVNSNNVGTKAGAHYVFRSVPPNGGCAVVRLKLTPKTPNDDATIDDDDAFDQTLETRRAEADDFYSRLEVGAASEDMRRVMRQALAGMLWNKQYYCFIQTDWSKGDPAQPPPPAERKKVRNREWRHLHAEDILSMPDKWEYPFFAVWDSAFHCIPLAMIDPAFAKKQLDLFTREWYMKPDGALPAYEWNFSDVNPPVHAWATFRVFKIERKLHDQEDLAFLERVFQKLLLNFTWWTNRKDSEGSGVFEGGFLGLDNIGPFNRSEPIPGGGRLRQADGTAWMAFYALTMLSMALELAKHNPTYEDIASKFFEHFIYISDAMTYRGGDDEEDSSLWSEEDKFYYDAISWPNGATQLIPLRSLVGLMPLYATLTIEPVVLKRFPSFARRMQWFLENRPELSERNIANMSTAGKGDRRLLAMVNRERLQHILRRMLDESEFLSDYGIRSLSKYHQEHPFTTTIDSQEFSAGYWPGDSHSGMFGGNSNWRGPIWLAVNFLLIESLQRFYQYYGDSFEIEFPTGSGEMANLGEVAGEIQERLISIFLRDNTGRRPANGGVPFLDYTCRDLVLFHEFFHGDSGKGLGASHQCGWTGLVAFSIFAAAQVGGLPRTPRTPRSTAAHYFDDNFAELESQSQSQGGSTPGTRSRGQSFTYSRAPSPDEL